mmetsp:Transcript_199/g.460  ORF Transcript_199/g.460 Transcript_199/m.460 type:complete len:206 (-) Transcript_199:155-772(-)
MIAVSCCLSSLPPDTDLQLNLSCSYDANSMASNGTSRRRNEPKPANSPPVMPSRVAMCHRAPRALRPANCPVCMRVLMTSVGTRIRDEARPAEVAAAMCAPAAERPVPSPVMGNKNCLVGSYTAKNTAAAGTTPARLPPRPRYRCLVQLTLAPPRAACMRVLMVSRGYSAASTATPASAPDAMWPSTCAGSIIVSALYDVDEARR